MSDELTGQQTRILEALRLYVAQYGYPPTVRDLGMVSGMTSTSSVRHQLVQLELKGRIRRVPGSPRAIEIVDPDQLNAADQAKADELSASLRDWASGRPPVPVGEVIDLLIDVIREKRDELIDRGLLPRPGNHTDTEGKR